MTSMASSTSTLHPTVTFEAPSLTTTFVAPAACTSNHLTMMEDLAWEVFLNELLPAPNVTITSCYPSQFGASWLSSVAGTSLPAFSPLVCPESYSTVLNNTDGYIACCPSGYSLGQATPLIASRPAYGASCYTPITTVIVTSYDNTSLAGTKTMTYTAGAQAFAYPIDGFAVVTSNDLSTIASTTGSTTPQPQQSSTTTSTTATISSQFQNSASASSRHLSSGAIAGIAIGIVAFLVILFIPILFFIRNKKSKAMVDRLPEYTEHNVKELEATTEHNIYSAKELDSTSSPVELHGSSSPTEIDSRRFSDHNPHMR